MWDHRPSSRRTPSSTSTRPRFASRCTREAPPGGAFGTRSGEVGRRPSVRPPRAGRRRAAVTAPTRIIAPRMCRKSGNSGSACTEHANHAPGFQIMSTRISRKRTLLAVWNQNARDAPKVCDEHRARRRARGRELDGLDSRLAVALTGPAANLGCDRPEHDRGDHPAVPDLVRVERDRKPDPEHDRSDGAGGDHHRPDLRHGHQRRDPARRSRCSTGPRS